MGDSYPLPFSAMESLTKRDENVGLRCEVKSLLHRHRRGEIEVVERNAALEETKEPYGEYALVSTHKFDEVNRWIGTTLEINSPQLLQALREVVKYYPGVQLDFKEKFVIEDPFILLVHYRDELIQYRQAIDDTTTKMHLSLLLEHLDKEMGPRRREIKDMVAGCSITFLLLWAIFKPGDMIYESKYGHVRSYILRRTGYGENSHGKYFDADYSYVSFDGEREGIATTSMRIYDKDYFTGTVASSIRSLPYFPMKFLSEGERTGLETSLAERGARYLKLREKCIMQYDGLFTYLKNPPWWYYDEGANYKGTFLPETMSGRVFIDPKTFGEEARAQKEEVSYSEEDEDHKLCTVNTIDEHGVSKKTLDTRLCPAYVYGFSIQKKQWCRFFIDVLKPIAWQTSPFETLILPAPQKRILQGLTGSHKFPEQARDTPKLKGKGLVILLYGPPGGGKTLTAEMTAEHAKRAPFTVSTSDLGEEKFRIDAELGRLLAIATTFQAIVLIDEADVFLEQREKDLDQNAIVAVFLRHLEYFQGIIFLTSNRVSVIDQAIKSRIHLALQYNSPDAMIRRKLWANHLARIPKDELDLDLETALNTMEGTKMNGREIANSIHTATTLAKSEGTKLKFEHLQTIVKVWEDFEGSFKQKC